MSRCLRRRAALLALVLVACSGPNGSPSSAPASEAGEPAEVADLLDTGQPLEAGRYTRSGFEPRIELELDGTWQAVQLFDGFFDVQQDVGTPDVIAVQFAKPSRIDGADGASEPADSAEAVELVRANPDLTVIERSDSRIGGLSGHQVTVANEGEAHARILLVPPGPLGIDPGRRLWIAFFDTDAGLLAIMVGGSTERWNETLAAAEPVLESVVIGR
ncbi:MAG TPA: hypothetical protein VLA59_02620 [Patescibacteria group bacterium]|nr:hypothetical protein [Patescibacteria group bacterium]